MLSNDPESSVGATTILLIRHGETAWNAERRVRGRRPRPSPVAVDRAWRRT